MHNIFKVYSCKRLLTQIPLKIVYYHIQKDSKTEFCGSSVTGYLKCTSWTAILLFIICDSGLQWNTEGILTSSLQSSLSRSKIWLLVFPPSFKKNCNPARTLVAFPHVKDREFLFTQLKRRKKDCRREIDFLSTIPTFFKVHWMASCILRCRLKLSVFWIM